MGPRNPEVQRLRRLLSSRRSRREESAFAIEGPELLSAALAAGWDVELVVVDPGAGDSQALEQAMVAGVTVAMVRDGVLAKITDAVTPQGCAAIVRSRPQDRGALVSGDLVVLDQVRDPGNLGAVVRVAEAVGAAGVVLTGSCVDPFGPKALRASTGSAFRLPIVDGGELHDLFSWLRDRGVATIGTSSHGGTDFAEVDWPHPMALVFGNEAHGLDPAMLEACDVRVAIPLAEAVESLNLSVAAGILLFASTRHLKSTRLPKAPSTMHTMAEGTN